MDLPPIEHPDQPAEVIDIEVRRRYQRKGKDGAPACEHDRVWLDEEHAEVECRDCATKINAVAWMIRQVHQFTRMADLTVKYRKLLWHYDHKRRCKCQHCGRITEIVHPTTRELEMEQRARVAEGSLVLVPSRPVGG